MQLAVQSSWLGAVVWCLCFLVLSLWNRKKGGGLDGLQPRSERSHWVGRILVGRSLRVRSWRGVGGLKVELNLRNG